MSLELRNILDVKVSICCHLALMLCNGLLEYNQSEKVHFLSEWKEFCTLVIWTHWTGMQVSLSGMHDSEYIFDSDSGSDSRLIQKIDSGSESDSSKESTDSFPILIPKNSRILQWIPFLKSESRITVCSLS